MSELTIEWVSYDEAEKRGDSDIGGLGGWANGNGWREYRDQFKPRVHPHLELLRKSIVERRIRFGGDAHQCRPDGAPLFSDGVFATYSYRGWGDLLSCVWNTEEETDRYSYLSFYMSGWGEADE